VQVNIRATDVEICTAVLVGADDDFSTAWQPGGGGCLKNSENWLKIIAFSKLKHYNIYYLVVEIGIDCTDININKLNRRGAKVG